MDAVKLPEAWAPSSPWVHRRVRLGWLPWALRRWVPRGLRAPTCVTHAPAPVCTCGLFAVHWGYFPAHEDDHG